MLLLSDLNATLLLPQTEALSYLTFPIISIVQQKLWGVGKISAVDGTSNDISTNFCQHVLPMAQCLILFAGFLQRSQRRRMCIDLCLGKLRNCFL